MGPRTPLDGLGLDRVTPRWEGTDPQERPWAEGGLHAEMETERSAGDARGGHGGGPGEGGPGGGGRVAGGRVAGGRGFARIGGIRRAGETRGTEAATFDAGRAVPFFEAPSVSAPPFAMPDPKETPSEPGWRAPETGAAHGRDPEGGAAPGLSSGREAGARRTARDDADLRAAGASTGPGDHELIRRAQRGDEDAFRILVERHQQRAFRIARTLVPSRDDAADLAQEAFLRIFRSLDRFDFNHEFTTWLYRIVTNLGIDHLRKRRPTFSTSGSEDDDGEFDLLDEDAPSPSDNLEREETAARVRAIIDRMPPHFRSVLALRELEGLPCTEIARIVGATHVTVRWRLHRGRKMFQEEWERQERLRSSGATPLAGIDVRNDPN